LNFAAAAALRRLDHLPADHRYGVDLLFLIIRPRRQRQKETSGHAVMLAAILSSPPVGLVGKVTVDET
jgi:hypothetical protein